MDTGSSTRLRPRLALLWGSPNPNRPHLQLAPPHNALLGRRPSRGSLMIFVHDWPEIGLMWRAQVEAFAPEGWRCVAPDMRGYGGSSAPTASEAYILNEIVDDMV